MKLTCIIVDDEPLSRDVLETYIADCPDVESLASCQDAVEAMNFLRQQAVDFILLDINMPRISGLSLVKSLENPPAIIFTTAYPEHAVEGFELEAIDYLLKPFSWERFMKAINKLRDKLQSVPTPTNNSIWVKVDQKTYQLSSEEIYYIKAWGDYVKIYLEDQVLVTHETLKSMQSMLPQPGFIRIHKSYLVSEDKIQYIEGNQVRLRDEFLPIGASYKERFIKQIKNK